MLVDNPEGTVRSLQEGRQAKWCLSIAHDFYSANLSFAMSAACFQPQISTAQLSRLSSDSVRIRFTTPEGIYCLTDSGHGVPCSDTDRFIPTTTRWTVLPIHTTAETSPKKADETPRRRSLNPRSVQSPTNGTRRAQRIEGSKKGHDRNGRSPIVPERAD